MFGDVWAHLYIRTYEASSCISVCNGYRRVALATCQRQTITNFTKYCIEPNINKQYVDKQLFDLTILHLAGAFGFFNCR